VDTRKEAL